MVWFGSTIFSTNKESMILSLNSYYVIVLSKSVLVNAYKKSSEVTQSHGVTSNKPRSASLICFIHQQDRSTRFRLFYSNHAKLRKSYLNSDQLFSRHLLVQKVIKTFV